MKTKIKKIKLLSILLTIAISLFSCIKKNNSDDSNLKVLKFSEMGVPASLDPCQAGTKYSNAIVTALYDTLYEYKYLKIPHTVKPNLAEGIPIISDKGLVYTIKLKKNVYFIDDPAFKDGKGREVTAKDFVYSIKRHFDPMNTSQGAWLWQGKIVGIDEWKKNGSDYNKTIEGLKAIDRYTVKVKFKKPFPQFIYTLAIGYSSIVPREAVNKYGKKLSNHPVGSGPFKLLSINKKKAILLKNNKYRNVKLDIYKEGYVEKIHGKYDLKKIHGKKLPIVDKVIIYFLTDTAKAWDTFTKGDEIQNTTIPVEHIDKIIKTRTKPYKLKSEHVNKYNISSELEFGFVYSGFNMENPEFGYSTNPKQNIRNKALRMAIRKGFNWPERIKRFYYGLGQAYPGVIHPSLDGFGGISDSSVKYDPIGAKKILKNYGWNARNLPVLEYSSPSSTRSKQIFEQFKDWMIKIGYPESKIKFLTYATFGEFNNALREKKAPFFSLAWGLDYPDAENLLQLFYGPNSSPGSNNFNFKNKKYDYLFEKVSTMFPGPERTALYKKLNKMIVDECAVISAFSRTHLHLWHKNVIIYPQDNVINNIYKYADVIK